MEQGAEQMKFKKIIFAIQEFFYLLRNRPKKSISDTEKTAWEIVALELRPLQRWCNMAATRKKCKFEDYEG